jgi:hypothetical protein
MIRYNSFTYALLDYQEIDFVLLVNLCTWEKKVLYIYQLPTYFGRLRLQISRQHWYVILLIPMVYKNKGFLNNFRLLSQLIFEQF